MSVYGYENTQDSSSDWSAEGVGKDPEVLRPGPPLTQYVRYLQQAHIST